MALGEFPTDHPIFWGTWKSAVPGISKPSRDIAIDVGRISMYIPTNMAMEVGFSMVLISLTSNTPQQWLEPLQPIFTWLPHSNMYPIVLYNYHYLSRRRKNYTLLLL